MKAARIFGASLLAIGFVAVGMEIGYRQRDAESEKPIVLVKACPVPVQTTHWVCDAVELREYRNVCLRRLKGTHQ